MNTKTIERLQAIGVNPAKAAKGVTYAKSGHFYKVDHYWQTVKGVSIFRVRRNGKLALMAQEQIQAVFV